MADTRILLVDDDADLGDLVSEYLTGHGFLVDVEADGESGLRRSQSGDYDLVVLDVMLPDISGFEVLRQIRASDRPVLPVVMLTAHGDEIDRIVGLELGADDYLPKPFNPRELLARIRAVLRRSSEKAAAAPAPGTGPQTGQDRLQSGDLIMDVSARSVWCGGHSIDLTATEFDLLHALLLNEGKVMQRDELARVALGRRLLPLDRSLDLHLSKLRRKLEPTGDGSERIRTVRGVGVILDRAGDSP